MNERMIRFKKNLEREYNTHIADLQTRPTYMLVEDAEEIAAYKSAYAYLRDYEVDTATMDYLMQFKEPLRVVGENWSEELLGADNSEIFDHMLFDITNNGKLDECEFASLPCVNDVMFYTGYSNTFGIDEAFGGRDSEGVCSSAIIEKVIVLSPRDYDDFCHSLQRQQNFIADNQDAMYIDSEECRHCLLVCGIGGDKGVLVYSDGYDYPCCCACISDIGKLELDRVEFLHGRTGEYAPSPKRTERER